jgi:hypothetical protein
LGEIFIYKLKVLLGYQKILDPKGIQTLEEGGIKGNKGFHENGSRKFAS